MDKDDSNKQICLINSDVNIEECKNNKYYLVNPTFKFAKLGTR